METVNQLEIERKEKLKALLNYELSENYKALKKEVEDRVAKAKATTIVAYCEKKIETDEISGETYAVRYTEVKKYNHKNKFADGIEVMSELLEIIDDSEGGKIIKAKIQEGIDNSEEYIGCALVKIFPGSGSMVEFRYSDVEFTDSDLLIYKGQVAKDSLRLIEGLIEEYRKETVTEESEEDLISEDIED